jgi:beta-galactosidase
LENEYAGKNREDAEQYILKLKQMAIESGMDTPLYSVTAWVNAVVRQALFCPCTEVIRTRPGHNIQ